MQTKQVPIRLSSALLADLDELVQNGVYRSRASAIRAGIEAIVKADKERRIDRQIAAGYTRHPPTEAEEQAAHASMREAIEEEPW